MEPLRSRASRILDRLLSVFLVLAACAIAVSVVRREFFAAPPAAREGGQRPSSYVSDWRDIFRNGKVVGDTAARVKLIEFVDYECPFCRTYHATLQTIRERFPNDVAVISVHFPLSFHRFARPAALASECADQQGRFLAMSDVLFATQDSLGLIPWTTLATRANVADLTAFEACLGSREVMAPVDSGMSVGARFNVTGTPTIILHGWRFGTPPGEQELIRAVVELKAGKPPYAGYPVDAVPNRGP